MNSLEYNVESGVCYRELSFMGFPEYRIGTDGSVWSRKRKNGDLSIWRKMSPGHSGKGINKRERILLFNKEKINFFVHHLVLFAFIGPRPEGKECCHNNGNGFDNRVENLRWDTHLNNMEDRLRHGKTYFGKDAPTYRHDIDENRIVEYFKQYKSLSAVARALNFDRMSLRERLYQYGYRVARRRGKTGYGWDNFLVREGSSIPIVNERFSCRIEDCGSAKFSKENDRDIHEKLDHILCSCGKKFVCLNKHLGQAKNHPNT